MVQSSFLENTTNYQAPPLTGTESIVGLPAEAGNATVLDFWRWAFGDLCTNDTRCTYGEWMVHQIFGIDAPRHSWAGYDAETAEGVRIEVKTSAYIQSWKQEKASVIAFGDLKSHKVNAQTGRLEAEETFAADLYVFCVEVERDGAKWQALELSQWEFYVLPRRVLVQLNQKSMCLSTVRRHCDPMTAEQLRARAFDYVQRALQERTEANGGQLYQRLPVEPMLPLFADLDANEGVRL